MNIAIPHASSFDSTLALIREGYNFAPSQCQRLKSDIFETRLRLEPAIFISGAEAAALFYDNARFIRAGAAPLRVQKTLTGKGGVQSLDDEAHHKRKAMFMALMGEDSRKMYVHHFTLRWQKAETLWHDKGTICLFTETQLILFQSACDWMAVPLAQDDAPPLAAATGAMIDGFGGIGPRYWKGRIARKRMERWAMKHINAARAGTDAQANCGLVQFAMQTGVDGKLLPAHTAAVELLNILRPITAIATYIAFLAHALHHHSEYKDNVQNDDALCRAFVQEVRRFYPFTPFMGARVRSAFQWRGYHFPKGRLVVLDAFGTNHDERIWKEPNRFHPERFLQWNEDAYRFIPQGGGNQYEHHRCAGEWLTVDTMMQALQMLAATSYTVPEQDMQIDTSRIPTLPKSGMRIHLA